MKVTLQMKMKKRKKKKNKKKRMIKTLGKMIILMKRMNSRIWMMILIKIWNSNCN
jgi:hypothetical protein